METVFQIGDLLVLPMWLLMIFVPRWRRTFYVVRSVSLWVCALPAAIYAVLALHRAGVIFAVVSRPDLPSVASLLGSPSGAVIAWMHFLAFDLFIGRWIYLDSREREVSSWFVSPILAATLLLGPIGFLLYLLLRAAFVSVEHFGPFDAYELMGKRLRVNLMLTYLGLTMLAVAILGLSGFFLDSRTVTGAPVWLKPTKFALSVGIYSFTFAWLSSYVRPRSRWMRWIGNVTALCLIIEVTLIVLQAARGTTSHFNVSTAFDSAVWATMGVIIAVVWLMILLLGIALLRQTDLNPVFAWALRLGVLVSTLGMLGAVFMVVPTESQTRTMAAHQAPQAVGAHSVGVVDGGPGLPFFGWSTTGGDLRVAHFLALHALQLLPLFGWGLCRKRFDRIVLKDRVALVWTAGIGYLLLIVLAQWQALRGEPLLHPSETILTAFALLAASFTVAAGAIIFRTFFQRTSLRASQVEGNIL